MCGGITKRTIGNTYMYAYNMYQLHFKIRILMFTHIGVNLQFLHITV
jgi:hypothetical protein